MAESTFQCSVVTPERAVLDCEARSAVFPAHDGEIGILRGRAPLLCRLGIGSMRVEAADGKHVLVIDGGFGQMVDNKLTILTEQAVAASDLDRATVLRALEEAMGREVTGAQEQNERQRDITLARAQLRVAPRAD